MGGRRAHCDAGSGSSRRVRAYGRATQAGHPRAQVQAAARPRGPMGRCLRTRGFGHLGDGNQHAADREGLSPDEVSRLCGELHIGQHDTPQCGVQTRERLVPAMDLTSPVELGGAARTPRGGASTSFGLLSCG